MTTVSREEKLILQMKNIEAIVSNPSLTSEQKVYQVTSVMSYLNALVNSMIEKDREAAGDSYLINLINSTFVEFNQKEGDEWA